MIVLDEQISRESLRRSLSWYPGRVAFLKELRPGTLIEDVAVPAILRRVRQPTFVTINVAHFWRVIAADRHYCIVCIVLPQSQANEVPGILRGLLRIPDLSARALRMGKVLLVTRERILCYQDAHCSIRSIPDG